MEAVLPSIAQLGVSGALVVVLLYWVHLTREDVKAARAELAQEKADNMRTQAEKEDLMRSYMRLPHELEPMQ